MLAVELRIPETHAARARWTLAQLALAWGLPVRWVEGGGADLVYGGSDARDGGAVAMPFDAALYEPGTRCEAVTRDGVRAWARAGLADGPLDLVGGAFRLLTFQDESFVAESARDRRGIFGCDALPEARRAVTGEPLVEHHAGALLARLVAARPALAAAARPRWPGGKRWAAVLTHDVDAVRIGAPAEIATNLGKLLVRRRRLWAEMVRLGLRHGRDVVGNPLWGFPGWRDFESARGIRSAFYLFLMPPGAKRDLNDCKSSVLDPGTDWGLLRAMADAGWEFGVHPPVHAKDDLDVFLWCKDAVERRLGRPVSGIRHHYWALDWRRPHLTWRKHANAGFRHDASIAWRDRAGFRAGTSLPFRPWDPGRERALDLVVLPSSMMDAHVIGNAFAGPPGPAAAALLAAARDAGGMAVLDWHGETSWDRLRYDRYLTTLGEILAPVLADDSCWFATPSEIARHWHERRMALEADARGAVEVRGAAPAAPLKVGLLGMPDNDATPELLRALADNGVDVKTILYWAPSARDQWKRVTNKLRSAGIGGVLSRVLQARARRAQRATGAAAGEPFPNARRITVPHHNSPECRDAILAEGIDVLIVATDAILSRRIFRAPRVATLNGHPGWVPTFRGLGSAWHQMRAGRPAAVSIHQVDEGIDTGPAFAREYLEDGAADPATVEARLTALRGRLFARVIAQLQRGEAAAIDTFLEPSRMTRGMPLAERRALEAELSGGRILRAPK